VVLLLVISGEKAGDVTHLKEAWRNLIPHGKYVPKMPHDHFMAG
jgi:hypothetical protein